MNYEPGPKTKFGFNRKSDVQGKVSGQSNKDVNNNTFARMQGAKKERVQDNMKQLYKTNVFWKLKEWKYKYMDEIVFYLSIPKWKIR